MNARKKSNKSTWVQYIMRGMNMDQATGYAVDSRLIKPGEIFFALPGGQVNGHSFLGDVAAKGASAAVVSRGYRGEAPLPLIEVDDVLKTLHHWGHEALLRAEGADVVAITGSVGKTTCKEWTASLLSSTKKVFSTPGNQNSQIGLPISLLNGIVGDEEVIVLEMGMNGPGQMERLVAIAPPDIAAITSIDYVHAGYFSKLDEIAYEKSRILTHPKTRLGLYPSEWDFSQVGTCEKRAFVGFDQVVSHIPKHLLGNLLIATLIAKELGVPQEMIKKKTLKLKPASRRYEVVEKRGVAFINDSYNASPVAVRAALAEVPRGKSGRKIAVLGEMTELGKFSEKYHRQIGEYALKSVDVLYCLGEGCSPMVCAWNETGRTALFYVNKEELINQLKKDLAQGDVVLIKGSNSLKMWEIIEEF